MIIWKPFTLKNMCTPSNLNTGPNLGSVGECRQRKCPWLSTINCAYQMISWRYEYASSEVKDEAGLLGIWGSWLSQSLVHRSQVLHPDSLEVNPCNLSRWKPGWDFFISHGSQVLTFKYDVDAYMATLLGGEAQDLCWEFGQQTRGVCCGLNLRMDTSRTFM